MVAINELFSNPKEAEDKLIYLMTKKKKDIQLMVSNGQDTSVFIDRTSLEQFNLFIGFSGKNGKSCVGKFTDRHFSFPLDGSVLSRVWIDCREPGDIKFHINISGNYYELSNDINGQKDELLIILLHSPDFVQLSLFDGRLPFQKVSHIFAASNRASEKIQTVGYSMINQLFPELFSYLRELEGSHDEEE